MLSRGPLRRSLRVRVVTEVLVTYAHVRWLLARHDIAAVVAMLRADGEDRLRPETAQRVAARLGNPVSRTLAIFPWDSRCLMRSLVLLRMMSRRGARCDLLIGARGGSEFAAHAWVEYRGRPVLPTLGFQALTVL
jgi:Transglutaminase-like superfamily